MPLWKWNQHGLIESEYWGMFFLLLFLVTSLNQMFSSFDSISLLLVAITLGDDDDHHHRGNQQRQPKQQQPKIKTRCGYLKIFSVKKKWWIFFVEKNPNFFSEVFIQNVRMFMDVYRWHVRKIFFLYFLPSSVNITLSIHIFYVRIRIRMFRFLQTKKTTENFFC